MASRDPLQINYCTILITTSVVATTYILNMINCFISVMAKAHRPSCGLKVPELWCQHRKIIKAEKMLVLIRYWVIKGLKEKIKRKMKAVVSIQTTWTYLGDRSPEPFASGRKEHEVNIHGFSGSASKPEMLKCIWNASLFNIISFPQNTEYFVKGPNL